MNTDLIDFHGFIFINFIRENPLNPCSSTSYSLIFFDQFANFPLQSFALNEQAQKQRALAK
jgi:hypothetical protein